MTTDRAEQQSVAEVMDPQAAAELVQELLLVTSATFAQLLPATATRAISGVPGLGAPSTPRQVADPSTGAEQAVAQPAAHTPAPGHVESAPESVSVRTAGPAFVPPAPVAVPVAVALPTLDEGAPASERSASQADQPLGAPVAQGYIPAVVVPAAPNATTPTAATPEAPAPSAPVTAVPVPIPVAVPPADPALDNHASHRPEHHTLAMLEEIGFLDE